jgi:uncharacterized protein YlxW (UPF0749 family)
MKRLLVLSLCGFMFTNAMADNSFFSTIESKYQSMEQARKQRVEERFQQRQEKLAQLNSENKNYQPFHATFDSKMTPAQERAEYKSAHLAKWCKTHLNSKKCATNNSFSYSYHTKG